jgi:hypothetical protein
MDCFASLAMTTVIQPQIIIFLAAPPPHGEPALQVHDTSALTPIP